MLLVFVFISLLCECLAWWGHGHLLVAEIAVAHLNKTAPDVLDVAFKMVAEYQDFFPKTKNFVPSAAWSDNLHSQDFRLLAEWHYNDRPWQVDENLPPLPPANPSNMIWALESCIKGISSPKLTPWAASFYIRWINHLIGDLHQPLHNIAQYSSNFPDGQGDRGGNECKLSPIAGLPSQISDLHKLWDSAGGTFVQDPFYPPTGPGFTPELQLKFANQTRELMKKYPFESFEMNRFDPIDVDQWSLEGFNLAIKYAYISDSQTSPPLLKCLKSKKLTFPIENLKAVQDITHQQIALAGYRLATVLKSSLPKTWVVPISSSTDDASQMKEIKDLLTELREAQTKLLQQQSNSTTPQSTKTVSPATVVICLLAGVLIGAAAACGYVWWRRRSLTNYRVLNDEQELGNMVTVS